MQFRPQRITGVALGGLASAWAFVFMALLIARAATQPVSLSTLFCYLFAALFLAVGLLLAYWTYACASLRYTLDRNGLVIHWGFVRQVIPLDQVKRLVRGEAGALPHVQGVNWLDYHVGHAELEGIGETLFYSTHRRADDLVYVVTPTQTYAVSPPYAQQFMTEVEAMRKEGAMVALRQVPRRLPLIDQPFWQDRWAQLLALAGILVCAVTFGVVFARYGSLPDSLAISFPPLDVERIASKHALLSLPATAFGILLVSLIAAFAARAWERLAAYMLLAALIAVQGVFLWGAVVAVS